MKLDPTKTALLTLDFQKGIFGFVPSADAIIPNASKAVEFARRKQFQIIHAGLGFSEGHPEIHRVLTEKIFPAQGTVVTADAFIAEQGE